MIEGTVYDMHEALIVGVWISIENTETGEVRNLRTDEGGRYSANLQKGRYRVTMRAHPGYPPGYEHSSFVISSGEKVIINFRPKPFAISDSIEGGHWIERYEGDFPTNMTHLIQKPTGAIRELRIQCTQLRTRGQTFEYRFWVIASFDRLTLHADKAVFDSKKSRLVAHGDVIFEDGIRVRRVRRVELNLLTGTATVGETTVKP